MANACRVTCIERAGNRITEVGCSEADGSSRKLMLGEVIRSIESGERVFYLTIEEQSYLVIVATDKSGNKYLKTVRDENDSSSLLQLADCR